jgi:hypothetical protein
MASLSEYTNAVFENYDAAYDLAQIDLDAAEDAEPTDSTTIDVLRLTLAMLNASRSGAWDRYCETIDWYPVEWTAANDRSTEDLMEKVRTMVDSDGHPSVARHGTAASIKAAHYRKEAERGHEIV